MRLGTGTSESMTAINSLPNHPSMRQVVKRKALTTAYFHAGVRDRFALTLIIRRAARASESERWSIVDSQRPRNFQFQLHFPCIHTTAIAISVSMRPKLFWNLERIKFLSHHQALLSTQYPSNPSAPDWIQRRD